MSKKSFKILWFLKTTKKKILRKTGLSAKPKYPENHETSETFFPDSFLKFKSTKQQINSKKMIFCIRHVPKLNSTEI